VKNLLFILSFFISAALFSVEKKNAIVYDTSKISTIKKASPQKEKEIFSDKNFIYHKEAKASKGWWEAFLEWLSRLFGKSVEKHPEVSYNIVKYILVALFIIGIIFVLWKSKFRSLLKGDAKKIAATSFVDLPENIEGINIDALIEEATRAGNYRLAVRWCFLKSLQWLSSQNKIAWQPAKTNIDYQNELKEENLKEEFISLSRVFEYAWYGEINLTESICSDYKNKIQLFINTLHV
jgi:hypothetical protein